MRRVPIRLKLAAALSVPLFALGVVTMLEVIKSSRDASEVRAQTDLANAATGPAGLISALQNERTWPGIDLVGYTGAITVPVEGYDQTRSDTDDAIAEFRDRIESSGGAIEAAYRPALDQLDQLEQLRADIDANVASTPQRTIDNNGDFSQTVFETYTALIDPFFDATTRVALAVNDAELRQGTELADVATRQIETLSVMASTVIRDVTATDQTGLDTPAEITEAATYLESFVRQADAMRNATGPYADIADSAFPAELTDDVTAAVDAAIINGTVDIQLLLGALDIPEEDSYLVYQEAVADQIGVRSDELQSAADNRRLWFAMLAAIVLGTAVTLTFLVSRSITKPLRSLTRQAKDMAERRLPDAVIDILETPLGDDVQVPTVEPVVVHTRDEVADVSTALNTVQDTALDLAVEQAVLRRNIADSFVNLGRRNQNLLGRQLDFITELESNETNADTLSNLFRLDHLATRMRRNAESLLVLAGIEPPRKWAAPVRLTDVIRAALGEVEDYQRVTVRGVEPATIIGSAAADLAHLLAELIENALVFSPPDQTVDIRGRTNPNGYTLAVIDSGLGMPHTDITSANRRLAGAESFTIAPSKYLGHYVAGNLAARHNIHVTLDNSPGNGITATIDLPPTLLTSDNELAPEVTPPHGHRALPATARPGVGAPAPAAAAARGAAPFGAPPVDLGGPRPASPAGPAVQPARTQSGLVKRAARDGAGSTLGAERPSGDLLAQLSRHSANLGGQPGGPPPTAGSGAPPPRAWNAPPSGPPGGAGWGGPPPLARRTPAGGPAAPPPPSGPSGPLAGGFGGGRGPVSPTGPGPVPAPPPPSGGGAATSGGLTRRVRGAQLPTTQPLQLRRSSGQAPASPPSPGPATPPPSLPPTPRSPVAPPGAPTPPTPGRQRADDVYSFLSSFSAGVQRGLDEAEQAAADRRREG